MKFLSFTVLSFTVTALILLISSVEMEYLFVPAFPAMETEVHEVAKEVVREKQAPSICILAKDIIQIICEKTIRASYKCSLPNNGLLEDLSQEKKDVTVKDVFHGYCDIRPLKYVRDMSLLHENDRIFVRKCENFYLSASGIIDMGAIYVLNDYPTGEGSVYLCGGEAPISPP